MNHIPVVEITRFEQIMRFWPGGAARNSNNNHQNNFLKLLANSNYAISCRFYHSKKLLNFIIIAKSPSLPNSKKCAMSVFTSVELFTSTYVSYRVGYVNISLSAKGDTRRNCIRWDMKFFMLKYHCFFQTFWWKLTKRAVFPPWKTSYLSEYSSA